MQNILKRMVKSRKGSVLVGVVAITIILSIAALAFAALSRNTISNEVDAFYEANAFYVAEAGLLMGTSWAKIAENYDYVATNGSKYLGALPDLPTVLPEEHDPKYDGFSATVSLRWVDSDPSMGIAESGIIIKSCAIETNNMNRLPYTKCLAWQLSGTPGSSWEQPGTLIDNLGPDAWEKGFHNNSGINANAAFYGPIHTNTPIYLHKDGIKGTGNANPARFHGPVTVFDGEYVYGSTGERSGQMASVPSGMWGTSTNSGNNYSRGIITSSDDFTAAQLDVVFRNTYKFTGVKLGTTFDIEETPNRFFLDAGNATNVNIKFGKDATGAFYQYSTGTINDNSTPKTYYALGANPEQTQVVIYAGTEAQFNANESGAISGNGVNLTVLGSTSLAGNVAVRTGTNKDITIDVSTSHLLYDGFTVTDARNATLNADVSGVDFGTNKNVFGFYSGGNVNLKRANGSKGDNNGVEKNVDNFYITAQVFASEKKATPPTNRGGTFIRDGNSNVHYKILGATSAKSWWDPEGNTSDAVIKSYFDKRKLETCCINYTELDEHGNPKPPQSQDPVKILVRSSWIELACDAEGNNCSSNSTRDISNFAYGVIMEKAGGL